MTNQKCNSFYCQRKHQCGRYENTPKALAMRSAKQQIKARIEASK